jgi:hypothetical protein
MGMTNNTLAILFFVLKPMVKKLLSIEIVIFHTFAPSYRLQTVFCSPVALTFLEKKIFGISEPYEQILERTTQGIFLQKISFLGIIVSEKTFKELLMHTRTSCHGTSVLEKKIFKDLASFLGFSLPVRKIFGIFILT